MQNVKFYILLPTFNRPQLVLRSVRSVLHQSYQNYLLIIFNDGSTCDYSALEELVKNNDRVFYIKSESNIGINSSRNKMLALIHPKECDYYFTLSDDDFLLGNALAIMFSEIEKANFPIWMCFNCELGKHSKYIENIGFDEYKTISFREFRADYRGDKHFIFKLLSCNKIEFPEKFYKNGHEEMYYFKINSKINIVPITVKIVEYYSDGLTVAILGRKKEKGFKDILKHIKFQPNNVTYYYWLLYKILFLYEIKPFIPRRYFRVIKWILHKFRLRF